MKNRLTDLDINDPFYKANKDKIVHVESPKDKEDEEGKPTAEYPCMCKGLANPYCPYHSDPNSPLQKEFDKIFRETYKTEPIILTKNTTKVVRAIGVVSVNVRNQNPYKIR